MLQRTNFAVEIEATKSGDGRITFLKIVRSSVGVARRIHREIR